MENLFENHGIITRGIPAVSPRETLSLVKLGAKLLDVRDSDFSDYKAFDCENVFVIPEGELSQKLSFLNQDYHYIFADSAGIQSRRCAEMMIAAGFNHIAYMSGGFVEWERDGLPVRTDVNQRLSGACACQLKPREMKK
jgi:rhodanese-related sulfurtransferase